MEKILSKELLLQNLNSTNMFLVKNSMLRIFEELLKGRQGLLSIKDIVFSNKSEIQAGEFFKNFGIYFIEIPQRNLDAFFNVLEQCRSYMPICRKVVLNMYFSDKLSKKEKHKCCVWLNNHCQLGNHHDLILKMLSYPEDGKLLLLAKRYCRQEMELTQEELEAICALPIRTSRKLEVFSLFIRQNKQDFTYSIITTLLNDLKDPSIRATQDEKNKMWNMLLDLLEKNPIVTDVKTFCEMYEKGLVSSDIYLKLLAVYTHKINIYPFLLDTLIEYYSKVVVNEQKRNCLASITNAMFFLLGQKKAPITEKVMGLLLKIVSIWQKEMWFKVDFLPNYRAQMYQGALLVEKVDVTMLKQSLKMDEQLFLMLVSYIREADVKEVLEEVAYRYSHLWQETLEDILFKQAIDILSVMKIIAELYKKESKDSYKQLFSASLVMLLNNLPEKENVSAKAAKILPFMMDNTDLQKLVENYQKSAKIAMANYLIG